MISGYAVEVQVSPGCWRYLDSIYPLRGSIYKEDTLDIEYLKYLRKIAVDRAIELGGVVKPLGQLTEEELLLELNLSRNE